MSNKVVTRNIGPIQELVPSSDVIELHTHREVLRLADELGHEITIHKRNYHLGIYNTDIDDFIYYGPFTLKELHAKLKELRDDR